MATIINNPSNTPERTVEREGGSGGWAVAIIILIAVVAGLIWWFTGYRAPAPVQQTPGANINVTLPSANDGGQGDGAGQGGNGAGGPAE